MLSLTTSALVKLYLQKKRVYFTRIKSKKLYIYRQQKAYLNQIKNKNKLIYKTVLVGHAFLS